MCGIVGSIDLKGHDRVDPALTRTMASCIIHRGPDDDGFFDAPGISMGMRRLSIIDESGGVQPIYSEDGAIALVFNGEIYNYLELRERLISHGHQFATHTDSETIVHLYEQYGLDLFDHLRGMFAFAIWDGRQGRLVLAVDHIGIKPLYLFEQDGRLHFASEVKALLASGAHDAAINLDVLDTYLSFGYVPGQQTMFAGVRRLMPGHALIVTPGADTSETLRFWEWGQVDADPQAPERSPESPAEAVQLTRELLRDSVRIHLRSDVPLGLFLSGGVDSATMLSLMSEFEAGHVSTYTVGYDIPTGDNELVQARRIAQHFNADHHEHVIDAEDWWQHFLAYVRSNDEPVDNPSAVSLQALAEVTARDVKVVLAGTGGDELFCGYQSHESWPSLMRMADRLDRVLPTGPRHAVGRALGALEPWYPAFKRHRIVGAIPYYLPRLQIPFLPLEEALRRTASYEGYVMSNGLRGQLYGDTLLQCYQSVQHKEHVYSAIFERARLRNSDPVDVTQALVALSWLPTDALLVADKVTMAHSLELRVPFFDRPLLDAAIRFPSHLKTRGNKWLLREAMRPDLPPWALERPKKWFGSPVLEWLDGPLRARTQEILLDERSLSRGLFDRKALAQLLDDHFSRRVNHVQLVTRLLILELWQRAFLDNEPLLP